jgi:hypothetical protein
MKWLLPLVLLTACDVEPSCEDSVEEYTAHLRARFEACEIDFEQVDATPPEPCDDHVQEVIVCLDDCVSLLSCGALTGSSTVEVERYSDCTLACPTL